MITFSASSNMTTWYPGAWYHPVSLFWCDKCKQMRQGTRGRHAVSKDDLLVVVQRVTYDCRRRRQLKDCDTSEGSWHLFHDISLGSSVFSSWIVRVTAAADWFTEHRLWFLYNFECDDDVTSASRSMGVLRDILSTPRRYGPVKV